MMSLSPPSPPRPTQATTWQSVEAVLYGVRSMARQVPADGDVAYLPEIIAVRKPS